MFLVTSKMKANYYPKHQQIAPHHKHPTTSDICCNGLDRLNSHETALNCTNFMCIVRKTLNKYNSLQKLFKLDIIHQGDDQNEFEQIAKRLATVIDSPTFEVTLEKYLGQLCSLPNLTPENTKFDDLKREITRFGYLQLPHGSGSHTNQFQHSKKINSYLNIQEDTKGHAKPFQVRQFLCELKGVFIQQFTLFFKESIMLYDVSAESDQCVSSSFSSSNSDSLMGDTEVHDEACEDANAPTTSLFDEAAKAISDHDATDGQARVDTVAISVHVPILEPLPAQSIVDICLEITDLCQNNRIHRACDLLSSRNLDRELCTKAKKIIAISIANSRNKEERMEFAKYFSKKFSENIDLIAAALCDGTNISDACDLLAASKNLSHDHCIKIKNIIAISIAKISEEQQQIKFTKYFIKKFPNEIGIMIKALCNENKLNAASEVLLSLNFCKSCDFLVSSDLTNAHAVKLKMAIASTIVKVRGKKTRIEFTTYFVNKFPNDTYLIVNALRSIDETIEACNALLLMPQLIELQMDSTTLYNLIMERVSNKNDRNELQRRFMRLLIENSKKEPPRNSSHKVTTTEAYFPHAIAIQHLIILNCQKEKHKAIKESCCSEEEIIEQKTKLDNCITLCNNALMQIHNNYNIMRRWREADSHKEIFNELEITILLQSIIYYRYLIEETNWVSTLSIEQKDAHATILLKYSEQILKVLYPAQSQSPHSLAEQNDPNDTTPKTTSPSFPKLDDDVVKNVLMGYVINFIVVMFSFEKHEATILFLKQASSTNFFAKNTLAHVLTLKAMRIALRANSTLAQENYDELVKNLEDAMEHYTEIISSKLPRNLEATERTTLNLMRDAAIKQRNAIIVAIMNYGGAEISLPDWIRCEPFLVRPWIHLAETRTALLERFASAATIRQNI